MAVEEFQTAANHEALFAALAEPFDPSEIKWRVTHTGLPDLLCHWKS
jgi:hypothetical protein